MEPLRSSDYFKEQKIDLLLKTTVRKIDPSNNTVVLNNNTSINFQKCLIAMGCTPFKPEIDGMDLPHIHFLRAFEDCRKIIEELNDVKNVVIIGAGFIGLEAAASLRGRSLNVTIVAPNQFPLENVVGQTVGSFLKNIHVQNGVKFLLEKSIERINSKQVILNDKTSVDADLVLVATGVSPNIAVLADSGILIENGIVVD